MSYQPTLPTLSPAAVASMNEDRGGLMTSLLHNRDAEAQLSSRFAAAGGALGPQLAANSLLDDACRLNQAALTAIQLRDQKLLLEAKLMSQSGIAASNGIAAPSPGLFNSSVPDIDPRMLSLLRQQLAGVNCPSQSLQMDSKNKVMNRLLLQHMGKSDTSEQMKVLIEKELAEKLGKKREVAGYRDVSVVPDPEPKRKKGRGGFSELFPQKLYRMLTMLEEKDGGAAVASFLPHGRAFCIHDPTKFVTETMPYYFRMSRFSSFQRQLNLYDFKRITEGRDKGAYYHEFFLRGRPGLCANMKRTKIKGVNAGVREEINFYNMPAIRIYEEDEKESSSSASASATANPH